MSPPLDNGADADRVALDDIDVSEPKLYQDDTWYPYFARLRREDPAWTAVPRGRIANWSSPRFDQFVRLKSNNSILDLRALHSDLTPIDTSHDMERIR